MTMENTKIITRLGKIEINFEKDSDFPLSIDGNHFYPSDMDDLYAFLKEVYLSDHNEKKDNRRFYCHNNIRTIDKPMCQNQCLGCSEVIIK